MKGFIELTLKAGNNEAPVLINVNQITHVYTRSDFRLTIQTTSEAFVVIEDYKTVKKLIDDNLNGVGEESVYNDPDRPFTA